MIFRLVFCFINIVATNFNLKDKEAYLVTQGIQKCYVKNLVNALFLNWNFLGFFRCDADTKRDCIEAFEEYKFIKTTDCKKDACDNCELCDGFTGRS